MKSPNVLYEPPKRARTDYRIGLSAWMDKSMLEEGQFYPRKTMAPDERLWWYSRYFDVVEVNSSFYAIPSADTARGWVLRTPLGFVFNVKAYGLLTGHHVDIARLPAALKAMLPKAERSKRAGRLPNAGLGPEARAWALTGDTQGAASAAGCRQARLRWRRGSSGRTGRWRASRGCRAGCRTR